MRRPNCRPIDPGDRLRRPADATGYANTAMRYGGAVDCSAVQDQGFDDRTCMNYRAFDRSFDLAQSVRCASNNAHRCTRAMRDDREIVVRANAALYVSDVSDRYTDRIAHGVSKLARCWRARCQQIPRRDLDDFRIPDFGAAVSEPPRQHAIAGINSIQVHAIGRRRI